VLHSSHTYVPTCILTYLRTPWSRVFLEKVIGSQLVKKFHFMELEGSLPQSQVPGTCPYPEPHRSIPWPDIPLLNIHLNIILPSTPGSSKWFLPSRFPTKTPYTPLRSPLRATSPAHLTLVCLITRTVLGEYGSLSCSLCSFLHSLLPRPS
jgi:hypothetical protein